MLEDSCFTLVYWQLKRLP